MATEIGSPPIHGPLPRFPLAVEPPHQDLTAPRLRRRQKPSTAHPAPSSLRKQGSRAEQSDSCFRRNDGRCAAVDGEQERPREQVLRWRLRRLWLGLRLPVSTARKPSEASHSTLRGRAEMDCVPGLGYREVAVAFPIQATSAP